MSRSNMYTPPIIILCELFVGCTKAMKQFGYPKLVSGRSLFAHPRSSYQTREVIVQLKPKC